jgi:hypothetical protein
MLVLTFKMRSLEPHSVFNSGFVEGQTTAPPPPAFLTPEMDLDDEDDEATVSVPDHLVS